MFTGEKINITEDRAVLHVALRNRSNRPILVDGKDVMPEVNAVLATCAPSPTPSAPARGRATPASDHRRRQHRHRRLRPRPGHGHRGAQALRQAGPARHFVSNVDGTHIAETLKKLDPRPRSSSSPPRRSPRRRRSPTPTRPRNGSSKAAKDRAAVAKHFVALSTNEKEVTKFGIDTKNMFAFWDWVGGRYSLWSAIGLPIALSHRHGQFRAAARRRPRDGRAFPHRAAEKNCRSSSACSASGTTISSAPRRTPSCPTTSTCTASRLLPAGRHGEQRQGRRPRRQAVDYQTGPIIWGEPGTNGQHAFYQLIHQGTQLIPATFLAPIETQNPLGEHHDILLSNFFAQTEALMKGKTADEVRAN
jgi:glucose-6-phosphate isomerase